MAPFAARAIIGLIFGFLIYETINESNKLLGLSLTPYLAFAIVPVVLVYVFQEFVIKKLKLQNCAGKKTSNFPPKHFF